jgi:hypothetical protein
MGTLGLNVRFAQFGFTQFRFKEFGFIDGQASSYQLMMIGGALLVVAALLMAMQSKTRNSLEDSHFRQELMSYLSRIASALERMETPSSGQNAADVLRRLMSTKSKDKVVQMLKYHSR